MRIALFVPCYVDTLYPETGVAMVHLFERLGHEVVFPAEQTCCGQIHFNTGYQPETIRLARRYVDIFGAALDANPPADAVVAPSASCVGLVREFYPYLVEQRGADLPGLERVRAHTFELSEFLVNELDVTDVGAYYPHRVTYHPTCHSLRGLGVGDAPLALLRAVKGLELVDLPDAEGCCGFGGTFAVKNAETSAAMLADKIGNVLSTRSEACVAADNSCLMHIGGGLSRQRTGVRTVHLAEILASTESAPAPAPTATPPFASPHAPEA